jgi:putative salt-induced outer membrane protein YdiY
MKNTSHALGLILTALLGATAAHAQSAAPVSAAATVKNDGKLRAALGLGASVSSGNSRTSNLSLSAQGVRATDQDRYTLYGTALRNRAAGVTSAEQLRAGLRYDHNLTPDVFAFGTVDLERDKLANLSLRGVAGAGLGYHLLRTPETTFDVYGGAAVNADRYVAATVVDGASRDRYSYASLLLGEESQHRLTDTTRVWQRLTVYPNLRNRGEFRASFGSGLSVAMSGSLNLTVGLGYAYNSEPGAGRRKGDTLLTTGVAVRFD